MKEQWPPRKNVPEPPNVRERWQKEIDNVWGLNPFGGPFVRLVWGQSVTRFFWQKERLKYPVGHYEKLVAWGHPVYQEDGKLKGYETYDNPPKGKVCVPLFTQTWVGTPRWFLEQWAGPNVASADWDLHRYERHFNPFKGIPETVDIMGPVPATGLYMTAFHMIAHHTADCCSRRAEEGKDCFGKYRPPDQRDINYVKALKAQMDAEPYMYGYDEKVPQSVLDQDYRDYHYNDIKDFDRRVEDTRYAIKDYLRPHSKRLTSEGFGMDKFKYSFVPSNYEQSEKEKSND